MISNKFSKYIFLYTIIAVILITILAYRSADWDLWARLAVGKIFFETGSILKYDIFAYTPTKDSWIDHECGTGVIFYYLVHYFGDIGLLLLKFFIIFFIFTFVFKSNQLRSDGGNPHKVSYYIIFLMGLMYGFSSTLRAQAFTYLFFALWIYLLDRVRLGNTKLIWIFPVTMLIWANVHGGFLAGLGLLLIYGIGETINRRKSLKYFGILTISGLVTLINPYGFKYWNYLFEAITMQRPFIPEWDSLNLFGPLLHLFGFKLILFLTLVSLIYLFCKQFKQINWTEILVLAITLYLSIKHVRHTIFFIIAAGSYIYYYLYPAIDWITFNSINKFYSLFSEKIRYLTKNSRGIILYSTILTLAFLCLIAIPFQIKVDEQRFPAKAVKFIEINQLSGNLLVLFNWGSYALWKLYPQCLITIDGRYEEVYPKQVVDDAARFHYAGKSWNNLIDKYHTDLILVPIEYDVYKKLLELDDWIQIYKDEIAAIFIPKSKNKESWLKPDSSFNPDQEKYVSNIKPPFKKPENYY